MAGDLITTMTPCRSPEAMVLFLTVAFATARTEGTLTLMIAVRSVERFVRQLDALAACD